MSILFSNNAESTLAVAIAATDVSITLPAGAGAMFPAPVAPDVAYLTIGRGPGSEVVKLTSRYGDTLTVVRAQDGTIAQAWLAGTIIGLRLPAYVASQFAQKSQLAAVATSGSYNDLTNQPASYVLPVATASVLGGVKAGANVTIADDGTLSASGAVTSVAGRTGNVTLSNTDISGLGTAATHAATDFLGATAQAVDSAKLGGTAAVSYATQGWANSNLAALNGSSGQSFAANALTAAGSVTAGAYAEMLYGSGSAQFIGLGVNSIFGSTGAFSATFYTNGLERGRFDSAGHLLVGRTTDDGSGALAQVNGSISSSGNLVATQAWANGQFLPLAGGTLTNKVTFGSYSANDLKNSFNVYDAGNNIVYGMTLWNDNGTAGNWSTMIFGPNQASRKISFGKINSAGAPATHADITEAGYVWLDDKSLHMNGNIFNAGNQVWHAGNFNPANYAALSGANFTGAVTTTGDLRSGDASGPNTTVIKFRSDLGFCLLDTWGSAKPIRIGGSSVSFLTENGAGVKVFADARMTAAPTISLAIGDTDTGFNWNSDGSYSPYANNVSLGTWTSAAVDFTAPLQQSGNQVWHAGNFNPANYLGVNATATNANALGGLGLSPSGSAVGANQVLRSDANGYTWHGWINTVSGDMGTTAVGSGGRVYCSNDGYLRYKTLTNFASELSSYISGVPAGSIIPIYGSNVPAGYLECNGAAVSRTTYATLFSAIGTTAGAGDGSTTFNVPDMRGEFLRGWDHGRGIDSNRAIASWQADDFKSHYHTVTTYQWGGSISNVSSNVHTWGGSNYQNSDVTNSTGGTETRPRNVAVMFCIKY